MECSGLSHRRMLLFFLFLALFHFGVSEARGEQAKGETAKLVRLQAEDGWILYAGLHLPNKVTSPIAGVVLVSEPGWPDRTMYEPSGSTSIGVGLIERGMAVLAVDPRGHGMSQDPKRFNLFSPQEVEKLRLDVRAAVQFLASQKNVDPERIGVLAIGVGATYAALEASANPAIQALVLISGESGSLSPEALDSIQRRSDLPVLCIAQKARRESVREMAQAYALSKNPNSDMVVGLGYGAPMVSFTPGLMEQVTEWLAHNVKGLGKSTPVTFRSSDGWTLYGTLRIPEGASEGSKAPGVVFVHGAKHDQATYLVLERMGVKRGMATLSFAWRGKGKTALLKENEGKEIYGIDILPQTHAYTKGSIIGDAHLDVKAAIEFLASQKSVDSSRIALVGGTSGAGAATVASIGDSRIKAIVTLSAYPQPDEFKQHLSTHDVALLAVVGADDYGGTVESAKELTEISKSKYSRLIMYETAPHGAEMLVVKPDLEPTIVRWLVERLGLAPQKKLGAEFRLSPPGGLFAANWR